MTTVIRSIARGPPTHCFRHDRKARPVNVWQRLRAGSPEVDERQQRCGQRRSVRASVTWSHGEADFSRCFNNCGRHVTSLAERPTALTHPA